MTNPAAIKGTFSGIEPVKTRSVVKFIIEVPYEQADASLQALGGLPQPAKEPWVAVALLKTPCKPEVPEEVKKPRKAWDDYLPSQQAAIRCSDPEFQKWVYAINDWVGPRGPDNAVAAAASYVRQECRVTSRSEIRPGTEEACRWSALDERYQRETGRMAEQTI